MAETGSPFGTPPASYLLASLAPQKRAEPCPTAPQEYLIDARFKVIAQPPMPERSVPEMGGPCLIWKGTANASATGKNVVCWSCGRVILLDSEFLGLPGTRWALTVTWE